MSNKITSKSLHSELCKSLKHTGGVITYATGHTCEPNGVGDYRFVCPTHGERPGFIPFYLATSLCGTCKCGDPIILEVQL
jgi:hypothetical protein